MRNVLTISILFLGLLAIPAGAAHAQNFTLEESVVGASGGSVAVGNQTLTATVGQPSPAGRGTSGPYTLFSGHPSPFFAIQAVSIRLVQELSDAQPAGTGITFTAQIQSRIAAVDQVTLHYRRGSQTSYTQVPMTSIEGAYEASIPAEAITGEGIAYFITARDMEGNTADTGVRSFEISITEPGLVKGDPQPTGDTKAAYRLVSVPIDLENASPGAVLADELGEYDNTAWRFFEPINGAPSGTQRSVEFDDVTNVQQGKAYWLIVRDQADNIDTGAGTVSALVEPFEIELEEQWNFIGNPYNFPVPVENLRTDDGQEIQLFSHESGDWNSPDNPVTVMEPFSGYAVFNESDETTTLLIDPDITSEEASESSRSKSQVLAQQSFQPAWMIRIRASTNWGFDGNNIAAVASQASAEQDPMDWPEPPPIATNVSLSFPHPEWERGGTKFSSDVRGIPVHGETWTFETETTDDSPVALTFEGLAQVPQSFEVWLMDEYTKASQDLRTTARYTIEAPTPEQARSFRLIVGESSYVEQELEAAGALPATYALADVYPNPTRGASTIRYGLPKKQPVTMTVYNVLGQRVATLMQDRSMEPGFHTIQWRGETGTGAPVASGVYFVRMRAGDFTASKKIVRVN